MTVLSWLTTLVWSLRWLLVVAALGAYGSRLYSQYDKLKAFKGPWSTGFTSYWLARAVGSYHTHEEFAGIGKKYGQLARIAPNLLITSSPDLIIKMSSARSPYTKSDWYAGLKLPPGQDNLFSLMDEKKHTARRAQMAEGYLQKTNKSLESSIDTHVINFIELIRKKYISSATEYKPMDLARKAAYFTLDVITDVAFGKPFGNLVHDQDMYRYIQSTDEAMPMILLMSAIPPLQKFIQINVVSKTLFPSETSAAGLGRVIGNARKIVNQRWDSKDRNHQDMMDSFIKNGMNEDDLVGESLLQIMAGSDTSATAVRATFLHILSNPQIYARLQAEIDAADKAGKISSPVIKDSEAQGLKYVQAIIKEGLRYWPPVTGLLSKTAPPGGDDVEIDGQKYHIPGNTNVGWCIWLILRNKDIFGADAVVFRPERWLIDDADTLTKMSRIQELVFGYGKYRCLGTNFAGMELNKIFVSVFREFDVALCNPSEPWKSGNMGLWLQSDMWVRITKREKRA